MKNFIYSLTLLALASCGGMGGGKTTTKTFNPQTTQTKVDIHPTASTTQEMTISNGVKLSVMVPSDLNAANQALMQSKLLQMATRGGVSGVGGSPTIVLAPDFALLSEGVTATVPAKTMLKYTLTLNVANILSGDVYSSASKEIVGVGDSSELALQNAINSISTSDATYLKMIGEAEKKIVDHYTNNGESIISQAQSAAASNQLDLAISLLSSIPQECGELFNKAQKALVPIYEKNIAIYAAKALAQMKTALATSTPDSFAEAMLYYQQIPHDSKLKAEADALYASTQSKLDAKAKSDLQYARTQSDKEFEHQSASEMLKLKMNIEGQEELLNKYKKDAAYERLPWIRKVIHLGDLDPFDGSGVSKFNK